MTEPILSVVEQDPAALASVTSALERRFGADSVRAPRAAPW
jgi:hypothetical protein